MLQSKTIERRQSEIRQELAGLVGKTEPSEDETRAMEKLDAEYRGNEVRFRAALVAEDVERREHSNELKTRDGKEFDALIDRFEVRQIALFLDEGRALDGPTAEVVSEMRNQGGYRGVPVPWQALERREGETVAAGVPDPVRTAPLVDRLFPESCAAKMGVQAVNIDAGGVDYPVATSEVTAGWASSETGSVAGPTAFTAVDRPLRPDHNLGVTMKITRKSLKQSAGIEQAIRRDMQSTIAAALDKAVFLGSGVSGEPAGIVTLAADEELPTVPVAAAASWAVFRQAVVNFMIENAANSPASVKLMIRPEVFNAMDDVILEGSAVSEWDRLVRNIPMGNIAMTSNALAAPTSPEDTVAVLTTSKDGVAPAYLGLWGGVDMIRDPYADAASGGLRLTALLTADLTYSRPAQIAVLTGIGVAVGGGE